jgi:hypothetical protein
MLNIRDVAVATLFLSFVTLPVSAQEPGRKLSNAASGRHRLPMVGIVAPADLGSSYQYVDLGPKGNQALAQDIGVEGNNLKEVPQGKHDFAGTKFKVGEKMVHVRGESKPELPEKVEGIKVGARFDKLHILQSTEFGEMPGKVDDGTAIGAYVVHYADKTEETIPIVYGEDVRDWWDSMMDRNKLKKRAKVAWRGKNKISAENGCEIRLFSEAWTNPHPDKLVATIDVVSKKTACAPFLVALTLETKRKRVPQRGPVR